MKLNRRWNVLKIAERPNTFVIATNTGKFIEMPEPILEPKFTKSFTFYVQPIFNTLKRKTPKMKQPISKTEKIKSVSEITFLLHCNRSDFVSFFRLPKNHLTTDKTQIGSGFVGQILNSELAIAISIAVCNIPYVM